MSKAKITACIRLRGVRHNNLKNFDLDLPLGRLIVVTGLSGSGKSSLAFDTLFAEGQRRYIETFSPYARQFFDRMDKPRVDSIEGIPPAIAIEQRNAVKTTRSTVGTMTEICDYMKLLWPHWAELHCRQCGQLVRRDSPQRVWDAVAGQLCSKQGAHEEKPLTPALSPPRGEGGEITAAEALVTFTLPLSEKISVEESLELIVRQGYQRLLLDGQVVQVEAAAKSLKALGKRPEAITVVQDRIKLVASRRSRFIEACEQAYHFGKGRMAIYPMNASGALGSPQLFSNRYHCAPCDIEYREPTSALFSFNHPLGACPSCKGFGRTISIDYDLAIPDRRKTLDEGAVRPWQTGYSAECQDDLRTFCRKRRVPMNVPFYQLSAEHQEWVIQGDKDYGKDKHHEWPDAWYGIKGYFKWMESKSYKMHVRVLLSRYRSYAPCESCQGKRFQPDSLLFQLPAEMLSPLSPPSPLGGERVGVRGRGMTLADFYMLPLSEALEVTEAISRQMKFSPADPLGHVLEEVRSRLEFLVEVGLGYLTLDRTTRSLSGGETERVNLTSCLGTRLVNTLYVLDEPSVGLHPRDTERLCRILRRLRDLGNTVVVVEHEAGIIRIADQIVDLGPGSGEAGGHLVFQGTFQEILKSRDSLTGQYLSGIKKIEMARNRPVRALSSSLAPLGERVGVRGFPSVPGEEAKWLCPTLVLSQARQHNLKDITLTLPLNRFVCVSGVSGSGKTTLIRECLVPALEAQIKANEMTAKADSESDGAESEDPSDEAVKIAGRGLSGIITGAEQVGRVVLVDQSPVGKTPRSNPAVYIGAFEDIREVFAQSDTAKLRGMNASAFSFNSKDGQCERCRGAGFEKIEMQFLSDVFIRCPDCDGRRYRPHVLEVKVGSGLSAEKSIADLLDATVDEAVTWLGGFVESRPAQRAVTRLKLLQEVGLGYLRLGQPVNTLSGGESQRLKLVSHLAEVDCGTSSAADKSNAAKPTLFLFDEPTTGLHFDDVRVLLQALQRLVDAGHSVLVIEHNLDVIRCADWVMDLGPEGGDEGGRIVAMGTPEEVARTLGSHTGEALRTMGLF